MAKAKESFSKKEKDPKGNDLILFESHDKELLGEACARVRSIKPPEPYK